MNVRCESCETVYRVDPAKVPDNGVRARCERCDHLIWIAGVDVDHSPAPADAAAELEDRAVAATEEGQADGTDPPWSPAAPTPSASIAAEFGRDDPDTRARRLATALISDIKAYYPDRWRQGLEQGSLREDLREEIRKSWDEYTLQVGDAMARSTSYFRDALNQILGEGRRLF